MKKIIYLAIVIVVVLFGIYFVWQAVDRPEIEGFGDVDELLQVNTTYAWTDEQKQEYEEIKAELAQDPENYSALLNLAGLKQGLVDYDGALFLYSKLHEIKPDDIMPLNNMGSIYYDTKQHEQAEAAQLAIIDINYKWSNSYQELMAIYRWHLKDKRDTFEEKLLYFYNNAPEYNETSLTLLAVYYDELMEDTEKAIEWHEKALEFNPNNTEMETRLNELKSQ